jgi:hypothetical protein
VRLRSEITRGRGGGQTDQHALVIKALVITLISAQGSPRILSFVTFILFFILFSILFFVFIFTSSLSNPHLISPLI